MKQYYIHDGESSTGPYSLDELRSQRLTKKTLVWYEGLTDWTTLENIQELTVLIAGNTPPPLRNTTPPQLSVNHGFESEKEPKPKNSHKLAIIIVSGIVIAGIIAWLVTSNRTQAATLDDLQQKQQQAQIEEAYQKEEVKRQDEELARKNTQYRNNWYKFISLRTNQYRYSTLGGIYGLEITVTNSTEYMLDDVVAYVTYIKDNGGIWKTIEIPVPNVPANATKTVGVPDVERGVSVKLSFKNIVSKKMQFYYEAGYSSGNPDDPYFAK